MKISRLIDPIVSVSVFVGGFAAMIAVVNATWEAAAAPPPQPRYLPAPCIGELAGPHMGACDTEIWIGYPCACTMFPPERPSPVYWAPSFESLAPQDSITDRLNALERMKLEGRPNRPAVSPDIRPARVEFRRA